MNNFLEIDIKVKKDFLVGASLRLLSPLYNLTSGLNTLRVFYARFDVCTNQIPLPPPSPH